MSSSDGGGRRGLTGFRFSLVAAAFLSVLLLGSLPGGALELSVSLSPGAVVTDGPLRLCSVATVTCDVPELLRQAAWATLCPSGNVITPDDVVVALSKAGIGGVTLRILMADRVPFRMESDIERWLRVASGWQGALDIQGASIPPGAKLIPPDRLYPGNEALNLRFSTKTGECVLPVRLRWLLPVVVADRYLRRGEMITAGDMAVTTIEARRNRRYYNDPRSLVGMAVERDMAKGTPFTFRITDEPDVIRPGSWVRIVCRNKGFIVTAIGRALDGGALGDTVKIRNKKTKKVILGIVTAPGIVEVTE
ncbi:MAG: flagella basal body P-ring formation protein FlgA [Dethiosulfovibrio peptidovorans]|nr:MAG: flagella basal body P-ring formation protein FlgA [Dethiosulfovibrio peptidovorans]